MFAAVPLPKGCEFWIWTDRITQIPHEKLDDYILEKFGNDEEAIKEFLRQGFVLPENDGVFNTNPSDAGRFMNHSCNPNCGFDGALREIAVGEELTMDYGFHGNPQWYQDVCQKYGVMTEADIAASTKREIE